MAKTSKISCEVKVAFVDMIYGVAYVKGQHLELSQENYERFKDLVNIIDKPEQLPLEEMAVASEVVEKKPVKRKKSTKKSEE